jgi:transcriptional regulator MraZ
VAFRGQYEHSLDAKDRLTIPARFRGALADGIVLVSWLDTCVAIFTPEGFADFSKQYLGQLNPLGQKGRRMIRRFYAGASDETLDSAGRVRIPRHMIEHAGLESGCVVVGALDHLEVWNPATWAEEDAETSAQANQMAEEFAAGDGQ